MSDDVTSINDGSGKFEQLLQGASNETQQVYFKKLKEETKAEQKKVTDAAMAMEQAIIIHQDAKTKYKEWVERKQSDYNLTMKTLGL